MQCRQVLEYMDPLTTGFDKDRKQTFIEAFSDALTHAIETAPRPSDLTLGLEDVPSSTRFKLDRIQNRPEKFDIDNSVMTATCAALNIPHTRAAVLAFLAGEPVEPPEEPKASGIVKLIRIDCAKEDVDEVIKCGEELGALGGELVMHPVHGYEVPEFQVPDEKVVAFCKGFEQAGITAMRLTEPAAV